MKKSFLNYLAFAALVFSAVLVSSCNRDEPEKTFTVEFNSNGGSTVPEQTVTEGALATKPADPTKADYTFAGWYKEAELTYEWNFSTDRVTADITLYAKWIFDGFIITAIVENGNKYNDIIRRVRAASYGSRGDDGAVHAVSTFANGRFSLTLPPTVNDRYLSFVGGYFDEALVNISDRNAKITMVDIEGWSSASGAWNWNHWVGDFIHAKADITNTSLSMTMAFYFYADRDVTITGSEYFYLDGLLRIEEKYDLILKSGWNMVYQTLHMDDVSLALEVSTTPVSGLRWYFEDDFYDMIMFNDTRQLTRRINADVKSRAFKMPLLPQRRVKGN